MVGYVIRLDFLKLIHNLQTGEELKTTDSYRPGNPMHFFLVTFSIIKAIIHVMNLP